MHLVVAPKLFYIGNFYSEHKVDGFQGDGMEKVSETLLVIYLYVFYGAITLPIYISTARRMRIVHNY